MRPFLIRCFLFGAIQFAIGYVLISKGLEPADEQNSYLAAILDKQEMLQKTNLSEKPRLILVGGSNVAFGFDSQKIAEKLNLQTVNFGLHAALGLDFPLNCVEEHVSPGDVVVVSFEHAVLACATIDGIPSHLEEVFDFWPAGRKHGRSSHDWKSFMDDEALDLVHHWVVRGKRRLGTNKPIPIPNAYQRKNFNQYGDMTGHHGQPSPGVPTYNKMGIDPKLLDRGIARLNQFHEVCERNDVTVYFSFPPIPQDLYDRSIPALGAINEAIRTRTAIPVINPPEEMLFPKTAFFDTHYHLMREAAQERTQRVLNGLERYDSRQAGIGYDKTMLR